MHSNQISTRFFTVFASVMAASAATVTLGDTVRSDSAGDLEGLTATVEAFRSDLGDLNAPEPGTVGEGRRQIDWDAAPDAVSAPNPFAGDFFNFGAFPRARGVVFTTPGTGFQLSATEESGAGIEFSNIDPSYDETFGFFSAERLFTPIGSNIVDVHFKVPGVDRDGLTTGFGAVFTDVDEANTTSIEYFDQYGDSLGLYYVETGTSWNADESLSFLGVKFDEPIVASVRIITGTDALAWGVTEATAGVDVVVMDDFIFGEPIPVDDVPGDVDGNGLVNFSDLLLILSSFGPCPGCSGDFDDNGAVDFYDLLVVLTNFD